jgi:predicted DNA-binding transcriptional regulator YafY
MEYLRTESSPEKPITTKVMIEHLNSLGISCDRRTLYKDMDLLMENDESVVKVELRQGNAYYLNNNSLLLAELKILIDAVQAANFITDKKSQELTEKLLTLGGMRKQEIIRENIIFYNNHKHSNEGVFDNIEQIEKSIEQKKQISFYYFDLDENANRVYRKDKKRYITDPIALVYSEDNYYLVSYSQKYSNPTNYRVDRMETVKIEDTPICNEAKIRKRTVSGYTEQVFKMYNGETVEIVLEFDFSCIGAIYDKFGESTDIKKIDDKYHTTLTVQISPPFWGWILQFGDKMKIIEPTGLSPEMILNKENN